ncbi:hypothetical protein L7F22_035460 [Adiantum nelumboides]|nr:hypothetical protein [Adiantum nelumboides]
MAMWESRLGGIPRPYLARSCGAAMLELSITNTLGESKLVHSFISYAQSYGNHYTTTAEVRYRRATNSQNLPYKLGLNQFANLTWEEFTRNYLSSTQQNCFATASLKRKQLQDITPPFTIHWSKDEIVSAAKNQVHCVYSTTGKCATALITAPFTTEAFNLGVVTLVLSPYLDGFAANRRVMKQFKSSDGNILKLLDSRSIDSQQVPSHDHTIKRAMQMHSFLVQRLVLDTEMEGKQMHEVVESSRPPQPDDDIFRTELVAAVTMFSQVMQNPRFLALLQPPLPSQPVGSQEQRSEPVKAQAQVMHIANSMETLGHQGCVNAVTWNSEGSMLLSGSDDTRVNLWDYSNRKLVHSIDSGHSANIFCVKFVPETCDDVVVSGAGDAEVRVHRISRSNGGSSPPIFRCHRRRVKKLAVEDGNPHVIWSASEDGTLRQYDLREGTVCPSTEAAEHECRNVLLDLRSGLKRSLSDQPRHCLSLKTCAINRTRPHQLLVGGSDAFARLYDRRMLAAPSSSRMQGKPPPHLCYLCPAHLSENTRSSLHLTHVTFSPNGLEVLLSYSGEHVYLMDVNNTGGDDTVTYVASDLPKRFVLEPIVNGIENPTTVINACKLNTPQLLDCLELLSEARKMLREGGNYLHAIDLASEVLETGYSVMDATLQSDILCVRAEAFLKRLWKNDVHMAIRDCNKARAINSNSAQAHLLMGEALSHLAKHREALEFVLRAQYLDPSNKELSDKVVIFRSKMVAAEEAKKNGSANKDGTHGRESSKIRALSGMMSRSEGDQGDLSPDSRPTERDDSDYDDDMEMEMEIEMLVGGDDERDRETGARQGSSLNLRLRRRVCSGREKNANTHTSICGVTSNNTATQAEVALDMRQRFVGHCNIGTDIKQATFLGERGDYVASGSDDGRWFIWHKKTGRLLKLLKGDENVVNCVQCHPFDCAIATSGIDNTIKLWTPCAQEPSLVAGGVAGPESADFLQIMAENQQKMRRPRDIGFPLAILQQFRIPSERGMRPPLECTQS